MSNPKFVTRETNRDASATPHHYTAEVCLALNGLVELKLSDNPLSYNTDATTCLFSPDTAYQIALQLFQVADAAEAGQ